MTKQIDTTAENNGLRLVTQGSHPSAPSSGHVLLYHTTGTASPGLFMENSAGQKIGAFITGSPNTSLIKSVWSPDTPPVSPSATDSEFSAGSNGVPSGFTEYDPGTLLIVTESN